MKDYHIYEISPDNFHRGNRCPYCSTRRGKVHPLDSFGALYPEKAKYWSDNNNKSPFEVTPKTGNKYKFICEKCGEEFERSLHHLNFKNTGVVCKKCRGSELEEKCKKILNQYNTKYEREKEFEKLIGEGNRPLRYDFYLPKKNILIECQGIQHQEYRKGFHETKKDFEKQLEHDRRKREYAKQHNIKLLEIWYYDMDNIEDILIEELNLEYRN